MPEEPRSDWTSPGRVAIIGAGSVGATVAYALMMRGLAPQIVLIDTHRDKCTAEAKDLNHGRRFVPGVRVWAGELEDCADADIIVVTAGAKQKPGQSRLALADANVALFQSLIPTLTRIAPRAVLLIVSNPVDVLTYVAAKLHPAGAAQVIGSGTVLDSARLLSLIAERIEVAPRNVHAYVVGEHGDHELALWSSAHVGGTPIAQATGARGRPLTTEEQAEIADKVRNAAAEIIAAKGATNWAIGLAAARIIEAIRRDEHAVMTVSRLLTRNCDWCGVSDVALSTPCLIGRSGVIADLPVPFSPTERERFQACSTVLAQACRATGI